MLRRRSSAVADGDASSGRGAAAPTASGAYSGPASHVDVDLDRYPEPLAGYAKEGHRQVDGWGIDDDLVRLFLAVDAFQKQAGVEGNLMEIGVHHGRSFILLALMARPGETSVAIDIFDDQARNLDRSGEGNRAMFERNVKRFAPRARHETITGDSLFLDFASVPALAQLRFAHIDGAHYVDAVLNDLTKTQASLVAGGVIVVDDFLHSGFPGVNEACHRFLLLGMPRRAVPFATGKNKLFLTTHSHHEALVDHLAGVLRPPAGRIVKLHGFDVVCVDPH